MQKRTKWEWLIMPIIWCGLKLKDANKRMITFGYQILRKDQEDEVIAEGETQHICVDSNGKTKSLPGKFMVCLTG
jgi:acyl-CoA thioesterase FadM